MIPDRMSPAELLVRTVLWYVFWKDFDRHGDETTTASTTDGQTNATVRVTPDGAEQPRNKWAARVETPARQRSHDGRVQHR